MFKTGVLARCISTGMRSLTTVSRPTFPISTNLRIATPLSKVIEPLRLHVQPPIIQEPTPKQPRESLILNELAEDNAIYMDSVLRKRRLKMKKHKLRKRRRTQRALKKRLGKI